VVGVFNELLSVADGFLPQPASPSLCSAERFDPCLTKELFNKLYLRALEPFIDMKHLVTSITDLFPFAPTWIPRQKEGGGGNVSVGTPFMELF
jgi:hypothetical protein